MSDELTHEQEIAELLCTFHDHGEIKRLPDHPEPRFHVGACFKSQRIAATIVSAGLRDKPLPARPVYPHPRRVLRKAANKAELEASRRKLVGGAVLRAAAAWLRAYADEQYPEES